jgi:hypothetical protein
MYRGVHLDVYFESMTRGLEQGIRLIVAKMRRKKGFNKYERIASSPSALLHVHRTQHSITHISSTPSSTVVTSSVRKGGSFIYPVALGEAVFYVVDDAGGSDGSNGDSVGD